MLEFRVGDRVKIHDWQMQVWRPSSADVEGTITEISRHESCHVQWDCGEGWYHKNYDLVLLLPIIKETKELVKLTTNSLYK